RAGPPMAQRRASGRTVVRERHDGAKYSQTPVRSRHLGSTADRRRRLRRRSNGRLHLAASYVGAPGFSSNGTIGGSTAGRKDTRPASTTAAHLPTRAVDGAGVLWRT